MFSNFDITGSYGISLIVNEDLMDRDKHPNFITSDKDNVLVFAFSVYCGYRCQNMRTPDIINPTPAVRCLVLAACQINVRPSMQEQILTASSLIYWTLEWLAKGKGEASRRFAVAKKICPLSLVTGKEAGSATNIYNTNNKFNQG